MLLQYYLMLISQLYLFSKGWCVSLHLTVCIFTCSRFVRAEDKKGKPLLSLQESYQQCQLFSLQFLPLFKLLACSWLVALLDVLSCIAMAIEKKTWWCRFGKKGRKKDRTPLSCQGLMRSELANLSVKLRDIPFEGSERLKGILKWNISNS